MSRQTELITAAEIISITKLSVDYDEDKLNPYIITAQRDYIRPALGTDYYQDLQDTFTSLSLDDSSLMVNYIQPALAYYTLYESMPINKNPIDNVGVSENDWELGTSAPREDYAYSRNKVSSLADNWLAEIDFFIRDARKTDSTKYPDYQPNKVKSKYGFIQYESKAEINSKPSGNNNISRTDQSNKCCE